MLFFFFLQDKGFGPLGFLFLKGLSLSEIPSSFFFNRRNRSMAQSSVLLLHNKNQHIGNKKKLTIINTLFVVQLLKYFQLKVSLKLENDNEDTM